MQWYNINAEWVNFSFWSCNIDSVYLTVHFIMHSLYLFALLLSESKVCPSNEVNSKHKEVNLKITQKCDLKHTTTSGYLIMYFKSILSIHCYNDHFQHTVNIYI